MAQTLLLHVPSPERAPRNGRHRSLPHTPATRSAVRFPRARCERLDTDHVEPKSPAPRLGKHPDDGNVTESKRTIVELAACRNCLTETAPFSPDRLADHSRRFETLHVALESRAPLAFRVKPAQQLIGLTDFSGSVAEMSASRGGVRSAIVRGKQDSEDLPAGCPKVARRESQRARQKKQRDKRSAGTGTGLCASAGGSGRCGRGNSRSTLRLSFVQAMYFMSQ